MNESKRSSRPEASYRRAEVTEPVRDRYLAGLLARTTNHWEALDPDGRQRLGSAVAGLLDVAGARTLKDGDALALPFISAEPPNLPSSRSVPVFGIEIAAGRGVLANEPTPVEGYLAFERQWLDRRGLDATQCLVVSVRGESMEPTLPAGTLILVDQTRRKRYEGRVYVVRSDPEDTLVVKRAGRSGGKWILVSDNPDPEWSPVPWPKTGTKVLGEVVWASGAPGAD